MNQEPPDEFSQRAGGKQRGVVAEFWEFLVCSRKWWLVPIVLLILLIGALGFVGGTGVAPFIYSLF